MVNEKRKNDFLFEVTGGIRIGDSYWGSSNVTWPLAKIKIFKRKVVEKILPKLLVKTYAMDIEMLAVAKYLGFERIFEGPIEVTFNKSTSAIKWSTSFWMAWDTAAVFYRLKILHYYDEKNNKNWLNG